MHAKHTMCAALLLCSGIAAQDIVSPANFRIAEGDSWWTVGLGTSRTPSVYLGIYEDMQGQSATLKGIAFRRDESSDRGTYNAATWLVNIFVSTAQTTAAAPNAMLSANHGPDKTLMASFGLAQFPQTTSVAIPAPFDYKLPFSQMFNWTGGGPICVEVQVTSKTNTQSWNFDWINRASSSNPSIVVRKAGSGCIATGETAAIDLRPTGTASWPMNAATFTYIGSRLPPNQLVFVLIGSTRLLGGVLLPLEIPFTGLGPSGPCYLHNNVLLAVPALSDASGRMTQNLGFRVNPSFSGLSLFAHVAAQDMMANPFGLVTSNGVQHHLVAPWTASGVGCVYGDGTLGPMGTARPNNGYVIQFDQ